MAQAWISFSEPLVCSGISGCGPSQQLMVADAAPQRALGGDLHRVGRDREHVDAEPGQVRRPRRGVGEQHGRVCVSRVTTWPDRPCPRM